MQEIATSEEADLLARSLGQFRRAILREGLLGAIRDGDDCELSVVQLGALVLLDLEGERTIGEMAEELGRSLSATSRLLDQLVRRGLVSRREDERDRRAKRIAISDEGHALVTRLHRRRAEAQLAVMARLSPEERAEVLRAMQLLADATARGEEDGRP